MKLDIIPIGNSRGIRLPKAVLEQCGITEAVEMTVEHNRLILKPHKRSKKRTPRKGWAEAARRCAKRGDDAPIWPEDMQDAFGGNEWVW